MIERELNIFVFRRDLRLRDNQGLISAIKQGYQVLPCFIFDPVQANHPYFSAPAFQFLLESLSELDEELQALGGHLYLFEGDPGTVLLKLAKELRASAVYFNRDYTPFARMRDERIEKAVGAIGVSTHVFEDALLNAPENIKNGEGKPYQVFTPYYKKAREFWIAPPHSIPENVRFYGDSLSGEIPLASKAQKNQGGKQPGGRKAGLALMEDLANLADYAKNRDFPAIEGSSRLSAHLKFGTVSVREVYARLQELFGGEHALIRQLYWRDFFTQIAYFFPHVFGKEFYVKYQQLPWGKNEDLLLAWQEGRTGFPIVDAGMRELNATGFMHGRVRMITASFLVKDLHQDWREGERYFATRLTDYDPAVNNGNWQWAASTGCDAQPYFRIFNPWLQQKRFDPDALYIKKWIPELRDKNPAWIQSIFKHKETVSDYPAPIVDHGEAAGYSKAFYRSVF